MSMMRGGSEAKMLEMGQYFETVMSFDNKKDQVKIVVII